MNVNNLDSSVKALERMPIHIHQDHLKASTIVAGEIAALIRSKQEKGEKAILGLATGATPLYIYQELVRMHTDEGLSFENVITFNLDEYYPMDKKSVLSYYYFMHHNLFNHVNIKKENINIPDGELALADVDEFCSQYEQKIVDAGGMDIQLLGIGRTGHIGFNEPPSFADSLTRMVKLDSLTIADATREFLEEGRVPRRAITMGIKTIFRAKKIFLLAWGENKAKIFQKTVEGPVTANIPASFLQNHENIEAHIDENAALELTRINSPWVVTLCKWNDLLAKRAVIWLSIKLGKPILKLTNDDYRSENLGDLIVSYGDVHDLNVKVFSSLQHTISGWPGGKPNADDKRRPERAKPAQKRTIVFSPHPDDDVISMGGTFIKLADQGHDVHVAYQTSGNIAVFDDDARRYAEFAFDFMQSTGCYGADFDKLKLSIDESLKIKKQGEVDTPIIKSVKGLIRKGEATAGARFSGIQDKNIHFLNLPFYETGTIEKKDVGKEDIAIIKALLVKVKPHQIFAAGDLRDPHGTHKVCLDAILEALKELKKEKVNWIDECYLWLYRGAWHEWPIHEIEMAVPLSPSDLLKKRKAIFKHQSQKDTPVFPGGDPREFWQRAEDRNRGTAQLYDQLGLTEYEAVEAFVRYHF